MTDPPRTLLDHRLVIVTGKGGTGKTTVAAALADAARRAGRRVLLAETAPISAAAAHFERQPAPLDYAGRALRPGLYAMRIDPHEALAEYLGLHIGFRALTERVLRTETFQQLLEAAPGWRELIILGKVWHLEQKCEADGRPTWDLVVVDAPATGHGLTFLDVPRVVQQAVRAGPLTRHAGWVEALIHDASRTLLLPVCLPEELPVRETVELVKRARNELGIAIDRIVLNRMPADRPTARSSRGLASIRDDLAFECLPAPAELRDLVDRVGRRQALARDHRAQASSLCGLPVVDLPVSPTAFAEREEWDAVVEAIVGPPGWPDAVAPVGSERRSGSGGA